MTDRSPIATFVSAEPSADTVAALVGLPQADLLSLVERLKGLVKRAHLDALGGSTLPRTVRKAARKAAYGLKSAGVKGSDGGRIGRVAQPAEPVSLEHAVMTLAPGMHGRMWFLLGSLPGGHAVEINTLEQAQPERIERIAPTSTASLRKLALKLDDALTPGMPFLCGIDLGARLLDGLSEEVRRAGGRFPQEWTDVLVWRAAAAAAGADVEAASARRGLGLQTGATADAGALDATVRLLDAPNGGLNLPPGEVIQVLAVEAIDLLAEDAVDAQQRLNALADRHADRWLGQAGVGERVARLLELTADTAWVRGDHTTARGLLQVADALGSGTRPSHVGLIRAVFRRLIDDKDALREFATARAAEVPS